MSTPLVRLLERIRGSLPTRHWLDEELPAGDREDWLRWLQPLPPATHASCPHCPDAEVLPVRWLVDRSIDQPTARVACRNCGLARISSDSLRRWQFDRDRFAIDLTRALGGQFTPVPCSEHGYRLGKISLAGRARDVLLLLTPVDRAVPAMERTPKAIVLVPTAMECPSRSAPGMVLALTEFLTMTDGSLRFDRDEAERQVRVWESQGSVPKPKRVKRANRAAMIERLTRELTAHLRAAKNHALDRLERDGAPKLLPRPTKSELGQLASMQPHQVSRCFQDPSARPLRLLWDVANDLEQILRYGGNALT